MTSKQLVNLDWNSLLSKKTKVAIIGSDFHYIKRFFSESVEESLCMENIGMIKKAGDHVKIDMRNGSSIVGLPNKELHIHGYRFDKIFFLDKGVPPDWLRPASEQVIQIQSEQEYLMTIAKETWETTYPERTKWEKLSEDTQAEWARFCENCIAVYLKYEK